MKIRCDFVSNSSSSSYIVSVPKSLGLEVFSQQLADCCSCTSDEFHIKNLTKDNNRKLDFCLNTYELLFFGQLGMAEKELTTSFAEILGKDTSLEYAEKYWKMLTDPIYESLYRKAFGDDSESSKSYVDEKNKVVHMFVPTTIDQIVVDKYEIEDFIEFGMNRRKTKFVDEYLEKLKKKFEDVYYHKEKRLPFQMHIDLFQITKNTIYVTEALKRHFPGKLSTKRGLKRTDTLYSQIRDRIKKGDKVCDITVNYSGGGIDSYSVYQEDGAPGMSGMTAIEILGQEA